MGVSVQVILIQENRAFRPGAVVEGRVLVSNDGRKPVEINGLMIWFDGEELVTWQTHDCMCIPFVGSIHTTKTYKDGWRMAGQQIKPLGQGFIEVGQASFPFRFQLPMGCPSSYSSMHLDGHVVYQVHAKLETASSFSLNRRVDLRIPVLGYLILDTNLHAQPIQAEFDRKNGRQRLRVTLPRRGYMPGDVIPFTVSACKDKPFKWSPKVVLYREEQHMIRTGHTSDVNIDYIAEVRLERGHDTRQKNTSHTWEGEIRIPVDALLTNLGGANFIGIEYYLKVLGTGIDKMIIRIVLGTGFFGQQAAQLSN